MSEYFITNRHNHYFHVTDIELDVSLLDQCELHATQLHMYDHVCRHCMLDIDEVEDFDLHIFPTSDIDVTLTPQGREHLNTKYTMADSRGCWSPVDIMVEGFISEFQL